MKNIYDIELTTIHKEQVHMSSYQGKVLLIVNVASKCGFTPQYDGLEQLYQKYRKQGLVILGFPCNQFGGQEPDSDDGIMDFCRLNFGVTFPMFAKIEVNGPGTHPLFLFLKKERPGLLGSSAIKWNFTKFLVDSKGHVSHRFSPSTKPESIEATITSLL